MFYKIKKGLEIPLRGGPGERIDQAPESQSVAVLGSDYIGLKPTMRVAVGDVVSVGAPLFEDKKNPGVVITSPASGTVAAINRGAKRALISVVINVDGNAAEQFISSEDLQDANFSIEHIREYLQKAGLWVAFRTRPYGKVPAVDATANSIFVNAMDTNPLAADPSFIIDQSASNLTLPLLMYKPPSLQGRTLRALAAHMCTISTQ